MSETDSDWTLYIKLISLPSLFTLCFIFGIFPYAIEKCRMNEAFLSYANTFSAGLFFGIGEFHLQAEGVEKLAKYSKLPLPFFLTSLGYSLILFIQKVIFGDMAKRAESTLREVEKVSIDKVLKEDEDSGKVSLINSSTNEDKPVPETEEGEPNESTESKTDPITEQMLKQKKLSAYIMLLALSIHGLFETLALGIQTNFKNTFILFIALIIHQWAEAFSLGIFFVKAKLSKKHYYLVIFMFAAISPIGVLIGIILSKTAGEFIEGLFLNISTGTFLYVACSEVIIEEFSTPEKRYIKFLLYTIGILFAAGLNIFEDYI